MGKRDHRDQGPRRGRVTDDPDAATACALGVGCKHNPVRIGQRLVHFGNGDVVLGDVVASLAPIYCHIEQCMTSSYTVTSSSAGRRVRCEMVWPGFFGLLSRHSEVASAISLTTGWPGSDSSQTTSHSSPAPWIDIAHIPFENRRLLALGSTGSASIQSSASSMELASFSLRDHRPSRASAGVGSTSRLRFNVRSGVCAYGAPRGDLSRRQFEPARPHSP